LTDHKADSDEFRKNVKVEIEKDIRNLNLNQATVYQTHVIVNAWGKNFHSWTAMKSLLITSLPIYKLEAALVSRCMFHHAAEYIEN